MYSLSNNIILECNESNLSEALQYHIDTNTPLVENVFRYGSILFIISYMIPLIPSGSFFSTFYATIFWINYSFLIRNKN